MTWHQKEDTWWVGVGWLLALKGWSRLGGLRQSLCLVTTESLLISKRGRGIGGTLATTYISPVGADHRCIGPVGADHIALGSSTRTIVLTHDTPPQAGNVLTCRVVS